LLEPKQKRFSVYVRSSFYF